MVWKPKYQCQNCRTLVIEDLGDRTERDRNIRSEYCFLCCAAPLLLRRDRRTVSPHDFSIHHRDTASSASSSQHCLDRCSAGNSPSHHPPSLAFTKHRVQRFFNSLHLLYPLQTFLHQKTSIFTLNEHLRKSQYEWNVSGNPSTPKKYVGREKYLEERKWQMW